MIFFSEPETLLRFWCVWKMYDRYHLFAHVRLGHTLSQPWPGQMVCIWNSADCFIQTKLILAKERNIKSAGSIDCFNMSNKLRETWKLRSSL